MPIVHVRPDRQVSGALVGCVIGAGIGPFCECGRDEALGLAVDPWRIGPGADVPEAELSAGLAEGVSFVAGAIVGHHAGDGDAEAFVIGQRSLEESNCAFGLLIGQDIGEGDVRGIVDADVNMFPADTAAVGLAGAVTGDAVAGVLKAAQGLDVEMDQLARCFALVTTRRLGRFEALQP